MMGLRSQGRIAAWWGWLTHDVAQTWQAPQSYDLYLPFLSWHNRFTYDKEKTNKYNVMPWGGGFGVSRYNDEGDWSALYTMMFKDSHNKLQPIVGYGWEKGWYPDNSRNFRLGLGFTAGITARDDFANYVPLPIILLFFHLVIKDLAYNLPTSPARIITATYCLRGCAIVFNRLPLNG